MLDGHPEEGSDVVPILLDGLLRALLIHIPKLLNLIGEDVELLIVGVFLQRGLSLQTGDDQFQADLGILHADCHIFLEEFAEPFPSEPNPFLIQKLDVLIDLTIIKIQKLPIGGIKEPILRLVT